MADSISVTVHTLQALLSTYTLYFSYISITNLQKYETKTEEAAKYSNIAKDQLHKTRTTQGNALIAILMSLATSIALAFKQSSWSPYLVVGINVGNALNLLQTRAHVSNFWKGKAKVPFVEGYNEAISGTERIIALLGNMSGSWALSSVLALWKFFV
ncbi:hypothetical protein K490DRAFT_32193 [Saccharata proteae CBS 121410]|uniref:Uncharacterized protein n=1 Tax=Saccharata proteae CBS 121410 TaxID=1314787 RepID=A0A9P4I4T4_9PEZI|nr:hypothetical protein K490DRAFT_32193 [Saccharata proteae CBS 121410]